MVSLITFGTVFRHKEHHYVYLATINETIYAAKILDMDKSKHLLFLYQKASESD